jgi:hypothetical protein
MPSQRKAEEFFYLDDDDQRQDADLHDSILAGGDHDAARAVSKAVMKRLGLSSERIAALMKSGEKRNG